MQDIPKYLVRGERARLFPVLADTSKEGRTASILLSCLANVDEFGRALMNTVGQRAGPRTKIETFTEVGFKTEGKLRPDGLIVLSIGSKQWKAIVEAKVGNSELELSQVESYLDLARDNEIDALITISNQFAAVPNAHPLQLSAAAARRKVELYHWSWMNVLTEASLLLSNDEVLDRDQRFVLNEMVRFLTHQSAGVRGFEQMPASWSELVSTIQAGAAPSASSPGTRETIAAWHQVVRDLSLTMSRQLGVEVSPRIPREHLRDLDARAKSDAVRLANERSLYATLAVPDAAAPIEIVADVRARTITASMSLRAPEERKGSKARLNWLLKQLGDAVDDNWHVRLRWPGRSSYTQRPLNVLRADVDGAMEEKDGQVVSSFDVLLVRDLGVKFGQRKNFISELEITVPQFYAVGQNLRAWQRTAPKLPDERAEPASVSTEAMRDQAEQETVQAPPERTLAQIVADFSNDARRDL